VFLVAAVLTSIGAGITLPVMNIIFGMLHFPYDATWAFCWMGGLTWMKAGWLVLSLDTSV
jgi:hypothetical protein